MKKQKEKIMTFRLSPRLIDMMKELKEDVGYYSFSSIVREGIIQLYCKRTRRSVKLTGEYICEKLGGKIRSEVCYYNTEFNGKKFEQKVPVNLLNKDFLKSNDQNR